MKELGFCVKCGKQKELEIWVADGGILGFVHGNYVLWCQKCILKEQIKEIKRSMRRLSKLEKKYKKLE